MRRTPPTYVLSEEALASHDDNNMLIIRRPGGKTVFARSKATGVLKEAE
jgi:hypothetical protein